MPFKKRLKLCDLDLAEVKDAGGKGGIGFSGRENVKEMRRSTSASRGNNRHRNRLRDPPRQIDLETRFRSVGIHRSKKYFPGPELGSLLCPLDRIELSSDPAAIEIYKPVSIVQFCVNGKNDALRTKIARRELNKPRIFYSRGIDGNFVGSGIKKKLDIRDRVYTSADRERDVDLGSNTFYKFGECTTFFIGRRDIEKDKFIRPLVRISASQFYRVAGIAKPDEVGALDRAAVFDVKAGNNAFSQHVLRR